MSLMTAASGTARPWPRAAFVLLLAAAGYALTGQPTAWHGVPVEDARARMVEQLAQRLATTPAADSRAEDWAMLGRSQAVLGRHDEARRAWAQALRRRPDDPALLAEYADALASAQAGALQGEPAALIDRALAIDPRQPRALGLRATLQWQSGDAEAALRTWQQLRQTTAAEHPMHAWAVQQIAQIEQVEQAARQREATEAAPETSSDKP